MSYIVVQRPHYLACNIKSCTTYDFIYLFIHSWFVFNFQTMRIKKSSSFFFVTTVRQIFFAISKNTQNGSTWHPRRMQQYFAFFFYIKRERFLFMHQKIPREMTLTNPHLIEQRMTIIVNFFCDVLWMSHKFIKIRFMDKNAIRTSNLNKFEGKFVKKNVYLRKCRNFWRL